MLTAKRLETLEHVDAQIFENVGRRSLGESLDKLVIGNVIDDLDVGTGR